MKKARIPYQLLFAVLAAGTMTQSSATPMTPEICCANVATGCSVIYLYNPPQFISYDHADERTPRRRGESPRRHWLRLHNNTSCAIIIPTGSTQLSRQPGGGLTFDLQQDAEVFIDYDVQDRRRSKPPEPAVYGGDEIIVSRLPAGRSVLFSVDATHFKKRLDVVVPFRYEWEGSGSLRNGVVLHRVYFHADDLPPTAR